MILSLVIFIVLNFLCFVPGYIINYKNQQQLIPSYIIKEKNTRNIIRYFYSRKSSDFIRFNLDFCLLFGFILLFGFEKSILAKPLLIATLIIGVLQNVYIYSIVANFSRQPLIISDLNFAKVGWLIVKKYRFLIIISTVFTLIILYLTFNYFLIILEDIPNKKQFYPILIAIIITGVFNIHKYEYIKLFHRSSFSPIFHLIKNYIYSSKANKYKNIDFNKIPKVDVYRNVKLTDRPNFVVISMESIGNVIFKNDFLYNQLGEIFNEKTKLITKSGFSIAACNSTPPSFGGGSWLSYSSLLFGLKLENELEYISILGSKKFFNKHVTFPSFLKQNHYTNYLVSGIQENLKKFDIDWGNLETTFNTTNFITHENIKYQGKTLNFCGSLNTIPDEYTLNFAYNTLDKSEPFMLFFASLNSHTTWHTPLKAEVNWEKYNNKYDFKTTDKTNIFSIENYLIAVQYQYDYIFNFISKNSGDNTIFILFGDHQPPKICSPEMGFETPLYIVSKNKKLIKEFHDVGFHNNLDIKNTNTTIRHEGFYSLFMNKFLKHYSNNKSELPIQPNGLQFHNK